MKDTISLNGVVATVPKHLVTAEGLLVTSFRLASSQSYYDRAKGKWIDAETNWYTVSTYRELAANTAASVHKGDRVLVRGWLRIRPWEDGEKHGTNIEVDANTVGHDLAWGKAVFTRSVKTTKASELVDHEEFPDSGAESTAGGPAAESTPVGVEREPVAAAAPF
jgi:single-strand DNA-binding protein